MDYLVDFVRSPSALGLSSGLVGFGRLLCQFPWSTIFLWVSGTPDNLGDEEGYRTKEIVYGNFRLVISFSMYNKEDFFSSSLFIIEVTDPSLSPRSRGVSTPSLPLY